MTSQHDRQEPVFQKFNNVFEPLQTGVHASEYVLLLQEALVFQRLLGNLEIALAGVYARLNEVERRWQACNRWKSKAS